MHIQVVGLVILSSLIQAISKGNWCKKDPSRIHEKFCPVKTESPFNNSIYIMCDVNISEGFNLRRDVYIRFAVFVRNLSKQKPYKNVRLVLLPFPKLYHWRSTNTHQDNLPWSLFFDMTSIKAFAPVIDFDDFLNDIGMTLLNPEEVAIKSMYILQPFQNMLQKGVFNERIEVSKCSKNLSLPKIRLKPVLVCKRFECLQFQGGAYLLEKALKWSISEQPTGEPTIILFSNTELVLHDYWGSRDFWMARRSMRFNKNLERLAADFRLKYLNSSNESDQINRPLKWTDEKPYRGALGGAYLAVHLRRGDFISGREEVTPTLKSVAVQILSKLTELNISTVYISTDSSRFEFENLKLYLKKVQVVRYSIPSSNQKSFITDGGIAIIDQVICSYARYFLGTFESTFTYRIYEEREILGFPQKQTFNTLCKTEDMKRCLKNPVWSIVF